MPDVDPEEFRRLGHAVIDWIADYRAGVADRPVLPDVQPGWVREQLTPTLLSAGLPEEPQPLSSLLDEIDRVVVPATTHWQHPSFFGYFPANASLHSLLGDMLSTGLGVQGMLWATSPAATEVEQVLLDAMAGALGLDPSFTFAGGGGGSIQDSASSAALVALLAALHRSNPDWRERGVDGTERVYTTAETHSALAKAVRVVGLENKRCGSSSRRRARSRCRPTHWPPRSGPTRRPVSGRFWSAPPSAQRAPVRSTRCARSRMRRPSTEPGCTSTPPWAGVAALCPELRHLLDGVELVDSFCTNAHKWLLTAFDASLFWVRDATALPAALSITPEFLRNAASESGFVVDYRDWQVPLGRRFRALKLWAVVHGHGLSGLRAHIRSHLALAEKLAGQVREDPTFELAVEPSLALVCLRVVTNDGPEADDRATRTVLERINASGSAFLTHTTVGGRYVIRVAIGSLLTEVRARRRVVGASLRDEDPKGHR